MSFQPHSTFLRSSFDWLFRTTDGRIVVGQFPNAPLWVATVAYGVRWVSSGWLHSLSAAVFSLAIVVWAVLELAAGVNRFRRLLGAVVLFWTVLSFIRPLFQ